MQHDSNLNDETPPSYLIFTLAGELFGSNLLSIKEVIKMTTIKPVPYMVSYFKGVINLRGQIVSVIDLRNKFDLPVPKPDQGMILVVEVGDTLIGAIVDDLISVEMLSEDQIERNPAVETKIPARFLTGIAKQDERLITLVDVSGCLSADEMRTVKQRGVAA